MIHFHRFHGITSMGWLVPRAANLKANIILLRAFWQWNWIQLTLVRGNELKIILVESVNCATREHTVYINSYTAWWVFIARRMSPECILCQIIKIIITSERLVLGELEDASTELMLYHTSLFPFESPLISWIHSSQTSSSLNIPSSRERFMNSQHYAMIYIRC